MDKQGRVTKWEEWEIGANYQWVKGNSVYGIYTLKEINRKKGWVSMNNALFPEGVKNFGWRGRYKKISAICPVILPCPFCGKRTKDIDEITLGPAVYATCYTKTNSCIVQCAWCGLSGPIFGTKVQAIEAWNSLLRRLPNP